MVKTKDGLLLNLSPSLRNEVKKAAKEANLTETAFIREAIKSRLRNPPEDPLYWLQPEKEDFDISSTGKLLLLMVAQILAFADHKATPDERKLAGTRGKKIVSDFLESESSKSKNHQ
jgi:hypothetical protein